MKHLSEVIAAIGQLQVDVAELKRRGVDVERLTGRVKSVEGQITDLSGRLEIQAEETTKPTKSTGARK